MSGTPSTSSNSPVLGRVGVADPAPDEDAEAVLNAFRGKPRRTPYWGGPHVPGEVNAGEVARARSRALSRLAKTHRAEFERYWLDEQWKIADGRTE